MAVHRGGWGSEGGGEGGRGGETAAPLEPEGTLNEKENNILRTFLAPVAMRTGSNEFPNCVGSVAPFLSSMTLYFLRYFT